MRRGKGTRTKNRAKGGSTNLELIHALSLIVPGTGPGGYFGKGNRVRNLDEEALGELLIRKIARTLVRAWIEKEHGDEFGLGRRGLKPSLQIQISRRRPFPNVSLKWNRATTGTTNRLEIENATVEYLKTHLPGWGNNRSPNNNYVTGSTLALGFIAPTKTVYFDHLARARGKPLAHEAFTGRTPGTGDIEAWIFLANEGIVKPGMIINFQNEIGQSIGGRIAGELVAAGYQVSVVPYAWWSNHLSRAGLLPAEQ